MGGSLSVKRALFPVSQCLQDCETGRRPEDFSSQAASLMPPFLDNAVDHFPARHSVSKYVHRVLRLDEENDEKKVVFRLLCSNNTAAGVIGRAGTVVRALENETGASIIFTPPIHGSKDRVAIISSVEVHFDFH